MSSPKLEQQIYEISANVRRTLNIIVRVIWRSTIRHERRREEKLFFLKREIKIIIHTDLSLS